ncbi:MAG: ArsR family transcriptional regulator [Gammaproteobacteria bacterium]|nr:ArsR family transcriptional regulator [Gammaproteobacteria bacterium]
MKLSPVVSKYIVHWGEMGSRWGVNRTVAQIHALLYLSPEPLTADEIATALAVARSNVSTSLRELMNFRLVKIAHKIGDRRDYFESVQDIWELFFIIVEERKRRELDPIMAVLETCAAEADADRNLNEVTRGRIRTMHEFLQSTMQWYSEVREIPIPLLKKLVKMGSKVAKYAGKW